jgi:hypothetical protein
MIGHVSLARARDATLLTLVFVRQDARGRGVVSALLGAVRGESDRLGLPRRTALYVFSGNDRAKRVYAAHGFVDTGERVRRADGSGESELWVAADGVVSADPAGIVVTRETVDVARLADWVHGDTAASTRRNMNLRGATVVELEAELRAYVDGHDAGGGVHSLWASSPGNAERVVAGSNCCRIGT